MSWHLTSLKESSRSLHLEPTKCPARLNRPGKERTETGQLSFCSCSSWSREELK